MLESFSAWCVCAVANDKPLLEPLLFPSSFSKENSADKLQSLPVECLLCNKVLMEDEKSDDINGHLLTAHNLVIGEQQEIADLPRYVVLLQYFMHFC